MINGYQYLLYMHALWSLLPLDPQTAQPFCKGCQGQVPTEQWLDTYLNWSSFCPRQVVYHQKTQAPAAITPPPPRGPYLADRKRRLAARMRGSDSIGMEMAASSCRAWSKYNRAVATCCQRPLDKSWSKPMPSR